MRGQRSNVGEVISIPSLFSVMLHPRLHIRSLSIRFTGQASLRRNVHVTSLLFCRATGSGSVTCRVCYRSDKPTTMAMALLVGAPGMSVDLMVNLVAPVSTRKTNCLPATVTHITWSGFADRVRARN